MSAVASGPAAFARASVRASGLPPSPPAATSPIETRTSDGTHSAVSSTAATAPASGAAARRRAISSSLPWQSRASSAGSAAGAVSLEDAGRSTPTSRPWPAFVDPQ